MICNHPDCHSCCFFFLPLYIYTGCETIATLMCYQRISGNIFNEQFFIFLKFYCQEKKKGKEEKENESNFFAVLISPFPCTPLNPDLQRHSLAGHKII